MVIERGNTMYLVIATRTIKSHSPAITGHRSRKAATHQFDKMQEKIESKEYTTFDSLMLVSVSDSDDRAIMLRYWVYE